MCWRVLEGLTCFLRYVFSFQCHSFSGPSNSPLEYEQVGAIADPRLHMSSLLPYSDGLPPRLHSAQTISIVNWVYLVHITFQYMTLSILSYFTTTIQYKYHSCIYHTLCYCRKTLCYRKADFLYAGLGLALGLLIAVVDPVLTFGEDVEEVAGIAVTDEMCSTTLSFTTWDPFTAPAITPARIMIMNTDRQIVHLIVSHTSVILHVLFWQKRCRRMGPRMKT